jgi:hypothetical protein
MPVVISGTNGVTFPDSSLQAAAASPYVLKNRIINGDMRIDQRNAGASVTPTVDQYIIDRWFARITNASKLSFQQSSTAPSNFIKSTLITSLSSYSVASTEHFGYNQVIEGFNISDLNWGTASAATVNLSFSVRSSLTGTFGGMLTNSAGTRSYVFSYTIISANTFENKTVTIAGDTSGTWLTDNGQGVTVSFSLGAGSSVSTTAGSWNGSLFRNVTGGTSVVGTNGATFYITGVQLEQNTTATPFERRLYNQELANCQRYYHQITGGGTNTFSAVSIGLVNSTTSVTGYFSLPVSMRTAPTLNYSGTITLDCGNGSTAVTSLGTVYGGTASCWAALNGSGGGLTAGRAANVYCGNATTNYFTFSSEL